VEDFVRRYSVRVGNTLICCRTGWDMTGEANLSRLSFDNCLEHLARHIKAVRPKVIVTFGLNSTRSVARLASEATAAPPIPISVEGWLAVSLRRQKHHQLSSDYRMQGPFT
jgi:uracil-DNA glycosylase